MQFTGWTVAEPLSEQRLQEIRERIARAQAYRATYAGADLPGVVGDDASALLDEVDRLKAELADWESWASGGL